MRTRLNDGSDTDKTFDVDYLNNYLLRYKSLNKAAIEKIKMHLLKH